MSENYTSQRIVDKKRYSEILGGADFSATEDIVPTRDEVAGVYKFLRYEIGHGHSVFSDRALKSQIDNCVHSGISYIKLRLILNILDDMKVMSVTELSGELFEFHIYENAQKTSIENSQIFRMLTANCRQ